MAEFGYWLSSEEHTPSDLVRNAVMAERAGFEWAMISDHYHPWIDAQGHSAFVWSVIGGIASTTERLHLGTGVTAPIIRIHPAILAQAAATSAAMMPGRFFLGVGTGENLNEHVTGERWPPYPVRAEMLREAVEVMRLLWQGGLKSHRGKYYTVENARLYTLPEQPPPILVAAGGPKSAKLAAEIGDGLINSSPGKEVVNAYKQAGGKDRPVHGQFTFCWARTYDEALDSAHKRWPTSALKGTLTQELPLPSNFEDAASLVTKDMIAESMVLGPDPAPYVERIRRYVDSGFTHIYLSQIGLDQEGFIDFWKRELQPALGDLAKSGAGR